MPSFNPATEVLIREYYNILPFTPSSGVWGRNYSNMPSYPLASEVSRRYYDERESYYRRHEEITQEITVQTNDYGPGSRYEYTQSTNTVTRREVIRVDPRAGYPLPPQPFWDQYGRRIQ